MQKNNRSSSVAILACVSLQPPIFPIDQPIMPEAQQIGRRGAIESLEANLDGVVHQWLIGKRRIGKTSVAKAVLARLRKNGAVALDVDLSKLEASTPEGLAGDIARQAQAAHAGEAVAGKLFGFARAQKQRAKGLSRALEGLGYENEGHPRRTMLISSRVHTSAHQQPDQEASPIVVELAIRDAREDRAWR
jgi:hypothetical protein